MPKRINVNKQNPGLSRIEEDGGICMCVCIYIYIYFPHISCEPTSPFTIKMDDKSILMHYSRK